MKKSKETFRVYENEVKNMNQRVQDLQQLKKKLLEPAEKKKGKKSQQTIDVAVKEAEIEKMQSEWNAEREALMKEKEELMASCKELQDKIKVIKDKSA